MEAIIVVVFLLAFLIISLVFELVTSKNHVADKKDNVYDRMRGEEHVKRRYRKELLNKVDKKFYLKKILPSWVGLFLISILLTRNIALAILLSLVLLAGLIVYFKLMKQIKRKEVFVRQFREALISMSNSLKAGTTLSTAIERCKTDLENTLRNQAEKPMLTELELMVSEINMGNNLAEVLLGFQERNPIEEVDNFVNAAIITERTGGNLSEVMVNVCDMIGDRIEIKREIESLTAAKRGESKILTIAPLVILPAMLFISPSYLKPMYDTLLGKGLMALAFVLIIGNYILGKKIMDIKL
jgi:tight adherence protein B